MDPTEANHGFIKLRNGLNMHYVDIKPNVEPARAVVVLVHGWPDCWFGWRHQIPALAQAGFRVIAPDLIGLGESDASGACTLA